MGNAKGTGTKTKKPPRPARPPRAMGRPTKFTRELGELVCRRLMDGQSLREICQREDMPHRATVFRWLQERDEFRDQYAHAREVQAQHWADELLQIADDASNDYVERQTPSGETYQAVDHEHIQRSRLRVDTRKFLLAKLLPKVYGEVSRHEHSGPDGGPIPLGALTDEQLLAEAKRAGIDRSRWPARLRELDEQQQAQGDH